MENAAAGVVRSQNPIRHHVRRKVRHGMMVNPASHTSSDSPRRARSRRSARARSLRRAVRAAARSACSSLPRRWRPRSLCPAAAATRQAGPATRRFHRSTALSSSRPFLADAGSGPGNCAGMEETTGAPSSFAALSRRRLRASSRDGGGVVNRPPSPLTMLLSRHTRRREVLAGLGAAAAWPLPARAQHAGRTFRIGVVEPISAELNAANLAAFRQGLQDLGYVEGRNLVLEYRSADGDAGRYPVLISELIGFNVDLIVTRGTPAARGQEGDEHDSRGHGFARRAAP